MEGYIGEIRMVAYNFAPRGWAFCNGQILSIAQNTALFSLLGTTYGGDGQTTFALPNLQSRLPIHAGQGPGLSSYVLGQQGGVENVTLLESQVPAHTHAARCSSVKGNTNAPTGRIWSKDAGVQSATYTSNPPDSAMAANAIGSTGGSQPHTNIPPYLTVHFIICLEGIYPSRN